MSALLSSLGRYQVQIEAVRGLISASPHLNEWPLCGEVLNADLDAGPSWLPILPVAATSALGGEAAAAIPVAAAWLALRKAAHLIDAVQDGDELPPVLGTPQTAMNCALALVFGAFRIAADLRPPKIAARVTSVFAGSGFDSAHGYHLSQEKKEPVEDLDGQLDGYWRETLLKSGSIYRAAVLGGAQLSGSRERKKLAALGEYGYALGVILQILDDCRDKGLEKRLPFIAAADEQIDSREDALDHLARLISPILLAWKQRGQAQLAQLEPSPAVDLLAEILESTASDDPAGESAHASSKAS